MKYEVYIPIYKDGTSGPLRFKYCLRCGRRLKNTEAQERGFGKICLQKQLAERQQTLF